MRSRSIGGAMLDSKTILIVDDSAYSALDLADAIEACEGRVVGPVATAIDVEAILESEPIAGVVIDGGLAEAATIIACLADRSMPVIMETSGPVPPSVAALDGRVAVLMRPVDPGTIVGTLLIQIGKADLARDMNKLGIEPKQV
jgi:hypothetical protein